MKIVRNYLLRLFGLFVVFTGLRIYMIMYNLHCDTTALYVTTHPFMLPQDLGCERPQAEGGTGGGSLQMYRRGYVEGG